MEDDKVTTAVAIGKLQTEMKNLSTNMDKGFEGLHKCFDEMQRLYAGNFEKIECEIKERIKYSDANQKKLEEEIVELKVWKKGLDDCKLVDKVNDLRTKMVVVFAVATILSIIIQFSISNWDKITKIV